ncbi:MAG TPA: antibiotic biosynthesis monooxygenase [Cryomorphaceae bacterium]|nr:antibiotic biosynthesis monooxygenase [Cryomorphaceae bacterium]|tara:strand:+ start:3319 stop:3615 length:297 start_codon:yes stop_codon:yes gene_type:complete
MIERIVKLAIDPSSEEGAAFRDIFAQSRNRIASQPGCHGVHLLESEGHFFTYSMWDSEADLNAYRQSTLFGEVWPKTKALFYDKPQTWTCLKTDSSKV